MQPNRAAPIGYILDVIADLLACLRFCSRLPLPVLSFETAPYRPLAQSPARALPLAGAAIGLCGAAMLIVSSRLALPPPLPVLLALTVLIVVTGALHEDGLADCADGFGGGKTPESRLAIMRDSRIGTFGTLALILAVLLRGAALSAVAVRNLPLAALVIVAAAAVSRGLALLPLRLLPPARMQGAGHSAARPPRDLLVFAAASAVILAFLPIFAGAETGRIAIACLAGGLGAGLVTLAARRYIGGQTGDVAGATQQIAEICIYLVFAVQI